MTSPASAGSWQVSVKGLVDRYELQCRPVRDLIINYLAERQPTLDYSSLDTLSRTLSLYFWKNLEEPSWHRLPPPGPRGRGSVEGSPPRQDRPPPTGRREHRRGHQPAGELVRLLTIVRAFYLDIAQWALEDPARWAQWAVPCPVSAAETQFKKVNARRKARMDQRTRERLPLLPALADTAVRRLSDARARLDAARSARPGQPFTVCGQPFTKAGQARRRRQELRRLGL